MHWQQLPLRSIAAGGITSLLAGRAVMAVEGSVRSIKHLANLTGDFREGGQQAIFDSLRERGQPTGHEGGGDDAPSVFVWVTLLSSIPEPSAKAYAEVLEREFGASNTFFALDLIQQMGDTQAARIQWMREQGRVRAGHAPTLVRCLEKYHEYLRWSPPLPMHDQRPLKKPRVARDAEAEAEAAALEEMPQRVMGGSHPVSPMSMASTALDLAEPAGRGHEGLPVESPDGLPHFTESSGGVRTDDRLLDFSTLPPEQPLVCLTDTHDASPVLQMQAARSASHSALERRVAVEVSWDADMTERRVESSPALSEPRADSPVPSGHASDFELDLILDEAVDWEGEAEHPEAAGMFDDAVTVIGQGVTEEEGSALTHRAVAGAAIPASREDTVGPSGLGDGPSSVNKEPSEGLCHEAERSGGHATSCGSRGGALEAEAEAGGPREGDWDTLLTQATALLTQAEADGSLHNQMTELTKTLGGLVEATGGRKRQLKQLCDALLKALPVCLKDQTLVLQALSLLGKVALRDAAPRLLLAAGLEAALTEALDLYGDCATVLREAYSLIVRLATKRPDEVGAPLCAAVRDVLKRHPQLDTAVLGFAALAWTRPDNGRVLGEDGGCEALVGALQGCKDPHVRSQGLRAMRHLCEADEAHGRLLGQCGAVEVAMQVLKGSGQHVEVWHAGLEALWALSLHDAHSVASMTQAQVVQEVVVPCLGWQATHEVLLGLVSSLAETSAELRTAMGRSGVCEELVLQAFQHMPTALEGQVRMLTRALSALAGLCLECPDNARRLGGECCKRVKGVLLDESLQRFFYRADIGDFAGMYGQACLAICQLLIVPEHRGLLVDEQTCLRVAKMLEPSPHWLRPSAGYMEAVLLALQAMTIGRAPSQSKEATDESLLSYLLRQRWSLPDALIKVLEGPLITAPGLEAGLQILLTVLKSRDGPRKAGMPLVEVWARLLQAHQGSAVFQPRVVRALECFVGEDKDHLALYCRYALPLIGSRIELAAKTQDAPGLLAGLQELHALLMGPGGQRYQGIALQDEAVAGLVASLLQASQADLAALDQAQVRKGSRVWLQIALYLSEMLGTEGEEQWAGLKTALLEGQAITTLVTKLKQLLEGWTGERDDDGAGNSVVGSLLTVLGNLARHSTDHRLSEALGQAGACEVAHQAVVTGLHCKHVTVLGTSCHAIMSLSMCHAPNVRRLLELRTEVKVVEALQTAVVCSTEGPRGRQRSQAAVLASWACSCLANLLNYAPSATDRQQLQAQLGAAGVCEKVAALLRCRALGGEPYPLVLVMACVNALVDGSAENQARMRAAGGALVPALQAMDMGDTSTSVRQTNTQREDQSADGRSRQRGKQLLHTMS